MNKQDEEKAKEIASNEYMPDTGFSRDDIEECCIEMAAWKEQQMIEKAIGYLEPIFKNLAGYNCGGDLTEDFKKYMEEN